MEICDELRSFEATGVYRLDGTGTSTGATFLDPVRLLNGSYQRFRVVPSAYYSRSFEPPRQLGDPETEQPEKRKKRKRNQKPKPRELNAMERIAEARHQEARTLLLSAHESLIKDKYLLEHLSKMIEGKEHTLDVGSGPENNFIELGTSWRAPFYEITICFRKPLVLGNGEGSSDEGYPTLPNRYLLYLPVQELAHTAGALLVLWITNREKLRMFVEKELLPSWGVKDPTVFYWLKVKPDGSLIGDLDLFHHRPYECLLLGYINVNTDAKQELNFKLLEGSQVIMSVPGSTSPELRRVQTVLPTASSKVASARAKLAERAKSPANSKAKGPDDQERRGKSGRGENDRLVPSARRRNSPPPLPVGLDTGRMRCSWITTNSDPLYVAFHDEEWAVPVHDDRTLFELLTLSQALAELTWPAILSKREEFREMFDGFNSASVSEFTEKKINLMRSNGSVLLSEQKIRAVVTNAKQMQKVVKEFGSFSNYCWSFVNHKPITNCFRYARQVPTKTPKAEAISRDLMRRGFQCVGPTTIYSFMQVTGIVNDHLSCCFRFKACSQHKASENNVRAESTLPDRKLSSPSSEDSDIREM
uniref:DNA-3-methyladenine glycosylase I n=1 Tax=Setaria italica TaxID=4555 RepID=K4A7I1_SETIT